MRKTVEVGVLSLGLLFGGIANAEQPSELTEEAVQARIMTAYESLQESCSDGKETAVIINMETGEWTNIALTASHRYVANDSRIVQQWGRDPDIKKVRGCHCHIQFSDRLELKPVNYANVTDLNYQYAAQTASGLDIRAAVQKHGTFFSERSPEAGAEIDFCIVPTENQRRFTTKQKIVEYKLDELTAKTAQGIGQGLLTGEGEPLENITTGQSNGVEVRSFASNLGIYGSSKAEQYNDEWYTKLRQPSSVAIETKVKNLASSVENIVQMSVVPMDREAMKAYLEIKGDGLYPTLTNDRPHIYRPCKSNEPTVLGGITPNQRNWMMRGVIHKSNRPIDIDGDGTFDQVNAQTLSYALRSCGFSEDWESKQIYWGIQFGNGAEAYGTFNSPMIVDNLEYDEGDLIFVGTDYHGNSHVHNVTPQDHLVRGPG